jgi:hypothetical protein
LRKIFEKKGRKGENFILAHPRAHPTQTIHMEFDTSKSKFGNPASIGATRERLKTILRKKNEKKGRKGENFILAHARAHPTQTIHMEFDTSKSKFGNPASIGATRERLKTILRLASEKIGRKVDFLILYWA